MLVSDSVAARAFGFRYHNGMEPQSKVKSGEAEQEVFLIFNSIHRVLKAEKLFKSHLEFKMQPTPRPLVSECGLSIALSEKEFPKALSLLGDNRIKLVQAFRRMRDGFEPVPFSEDAS